MTTIQQLTDLISDSFAVRFSPKRCSPEERLSGMFVGGQQTDTEHAAKTRAGMLRKRHPAWAKAFLDGFYSRPDAPPRPPATARPIMAPSATPRSSVATAMADMEKNISELERTLISALAQEFRDLSTSGTETAVRCMKRQIKRAELCSYTALLGEFFTTVESVSGEQNVLTQLKFAVMQNWLTLAKLDLSVFKVLLPIINPEPKYSQYIEEADEIADKWASKDEEGIEDALSCRNREYTPDARASYDAELVALRSAYADAIRRHDEQMTQASTFWLKTVELDIHCIRYAWIAEYVVDYPPIVFMSIDPPGTDWPSPTVSWDPFKEQGGALALFTSS